jgi:hypothetical protein
MKRLWAISAAALCVSLLSAACAPAQAATPFPVVELPPAPRVSHRLANAAVLTGAVMIASSFLLERQADRLYDQYLDSSDPPEISRLYDRTTRYDHWSSATLISGNVLVAAGLAMRFLHAAPGSRVQLALDPRRCAVTCSF